MEQNEDPKLLTVKREVLFVDSSNPDEFQEGSSQASDSQEMLPIRMTEKSIYYPAAFRLDESNICAEAVEAVLFDSLEGELILAEYQQNNFLCSNTQQKLTDLLLSRTAKAMTVYAQTKHIQNYFVKLTDAIKTLMPNEERTVYYIPAQTPGNDTKNPKGKLPDKWRNYLYNLRIRGIITKKRKEKEKTIQQETKTQIIKDLVESHIQKLKESNTVAEIAQPWSATYEYRQQLRTSLNNLEDVLTEWPIIKSPLGAQLINDEFTALFGSKDISERWNSFFELLFDLKKSTTRDNIGKDYCTMYENLTSSCIQDLSGIQIQLLPYLIAPVSKFKTGNGTMIKPSASESSEGFVTYCKNAESIAESVNHRNDRYKNWKIPIQPCMLLQGETPFNIKASYVSLKHDFWKADSPLHALDLTFKLYKVFNLQFPIDCEHLWMIIQKSVYEIETPQDKKISSVSSLTNMLNIKMKNKRQKTM